MAQDVKINIDFKIVENINKNVEQMTKKLKGVSKIKFAGFSNIFSKAAIGITGINQGLELLRKGFNLAKNAVVPFIEEAIKIEDLSTQFETLTGSVANAQALMEDLVTFAARTPFQIEGLARASKTLLAFGTEQERITERLTMLGDAAAATGNDLGSIAQIFGQVQAAGKLTGERFLQLTERGINVGPAIAKSMGVAETELEKLRSQGKITFEIFDKAFKTMTSEGGKFANGMIKQSKTLSGVLSTLSDAWKQIQASVGKFFLPAIKKASIALTKFLNDNKKEITAFIKNTLVSLLRAVAHTVDAIANLKQNFKVGFGIDNTDRELQSLFIHLNLLNKELDKETGFDKRENIIKSMDKIRGRINELESGIKEGLGSKASRIISGFADDLDNLSKKDLDIKVEINGKALPTSKGLADIGPSIIGQMKFPEAINLITSTFKSGDAKTAIVSVFKKSGNILLQAAATVVDILGGTEEKFRTLIKSLLTTARELPKQMITNIGVLFEEIIKDAPAAITAMFETLTGEFATTAIRKVVAAFENEEQMNKIGQAVARGIATWIADPFVGVAIAAAVVKGLISGFSTAIPAIIQGFIDEIRGSGIGDFFGNTFSGFNNLVDKMGVVGDVFEGAVNIFKDALTGFAGGGLSKIGSGDIFGGIKDIATGPISSIGDSLGFAEGGDVPNLSKFNNDRFPARLSAGESVLTKTTSDRLNEFLNNQGGQSQNVVVNLQVGEEELANVLLSLNEKGFRVA